MIPKHKQLGASLLVSLIMLLVLTMLVVSAIRSSNISLRITGNVQSQLEATAAAQQAIEQVLSNDDIFLAPAGQTIMVGSYSVTIGTPTCYMKSLVANNTSVDPNHNLYQDPNHTDGTPTDVYDTFWNVPATVSDSAVTGARVVVNQGVRIRLPATPDPCP